MLKYIFAAIFIALAWALVLVFHDTIPMWPAIVVTVVIVVALIAWAIYRVLAAKSAATKIEKGLRDQAAQHSEGIRPDMAAEIAAMEAEFQKGVQALKGSAAGRSGRDALSVLPWYVMIGPSASGKTTAIRSSGLKMPAGKAGKVRGVGGTRNCDWWMTNEAILLDTAGRWSTDDDDREEWLAFLDLLQPDAAQEADQRHPAGDQRHRSAGQRRADRRAGDHAARAHRRGDRAARGRGAGLPHHHQVRSDLGLRRDLRRAEGSRARPDPRLQPAADQPARRPRRGVRAATSTI